jgi:hypothetical protein
MLPDMGVANVYNIMHMLFLITFGGIIDDVDK